MLSVIHNRLPRRCVSPTPKCLYTTLFCQIIFILLGYVSYQQGYPREVGMYLSYATRPIWDEVGEGFETLVHYHAEGVPMETLCKVHGWNYSEGTSNRIVDAIIFANELDLLEIRLVELMPVVDIFFIVESDKTFTSKTKPYVFKENEKRFAFAKDKIIYSQFLSPPVTPEEAKKGWTLEGRLRGFMNAVLSAHVRQGDFVIMSDVDEIPSRHTIALWRNCKGMPDDMHLAMRYYLYSFEFPITHQAGYTSPPNWYSWRPKIRKWRNDVYYNHGRVTSQLLVECGWHCSFCFRTIHDFIFKMQAYSHSDRVRKPSFLEYDRVQRIACNGADIYDMPPEAFTYYDLIMNWPPPQKTKNMVHAPVALVENPEKYSFLLPGNCVREG